MGPPELILEMCKPKKEPIPLVDPIPAKIRIQATPTPTPLLVVPVPEPDPAKNGFVTPLVWVSLKSSPRMNGSTRWTLWTRELKTRNLSNLRMQFSIVTLHLSTVDCGVGVWSSIIVFENHGSIVDQVSCIFYHVPPWISFMATLLLTLFHCTENSFILVLNFL